MKRKKKQKLKKPVKFSTGGTKNLTEGRKLAARMVEIAERKRNGS